MAEKMSKSSNIEPSGIVLTPEAEIESLKAQVHYWQTRHELLLKYGREDTMASSTMRP